ncbi:MAG: hypothetical protein ACYTHM_23410 [Planctomycetota bacterium]|jgi:hypothetical protein
MRRSDGSFLLALGWASFALVTVAFGGEPNKGPAKKEDFSRYDLIKYINPFSPDPPKKPEKPKPSAPKEKPKPPKKIRIEPKNLHFAGVTYDNRRKAYAAMVEIEGKGPVFLEPGGKVGVWEVVRVDMGGMEVKGKDGKAVQFPVGEAFHDGKTVIWKTEGEPERTPEPKAAPEKKEVSKPSSIPKMDADRRREIIEKLRKRREEAKRRAASGK